MRVTSGSVSASRLRAWSSVSAEDNIRRWLTRQQTGCAFAALSASEPARLTMATFEGLATSADIDALFDFAATQSKPAIAVLTRARTEQQVAEQLLELANGDRWRVWRSAVPAGIETDDVFVAMKWRTSAAEELWSSPMGLGPLGAMPATRRAPTTCIAAWPGGRANKFRKKVEPVVHFLDVDLAGYRLSSERYQRLRKQSVKATTEILFDDSASHYRNIAFRLSSAVAEQLRPLPTAET